MEKPESVRGDFYEVSETLGDPRTGGASLVDARDATGSIFKCSEALTGPSLDGLTRSCCLPSNSIDCAGILKLRNSDIELRKGETDIGRKNTRVRMVFRVHVNQATGRTVSLQVASNPIECCEYLSSSPSLKRFKCFYLRTTTCSGPPVQSEVCPASVTSVVRFCTSTTSVSCSCLYIVPSKFGFLEFSSHRVSVSVQGQTRNVMLR